MLPDPNPTQLRKLVEDPDVVSHRSLFCRWYDRCLDRAVDGRWASWTCEHCPMFVGELSVPNVA